MANSSSSFSTEQLDADAERALAVVEAAGASAPALVAEWLQRSNAAAVQAVAELGDGAARKAARRGLSVLKARGVQLPELPRKGRAPAAVEATRQAWLLPPDSSGVVGLVLAERQSSGSYVAAFVYFRDGQNILRVQTGTLALSKIKESMNQALGGAGYGPVAVPYGWSQHRIAERRAWHLAQNVPEPLGMTAAQRLLEGAPSVAPAHPFDEEGLALGDEDAEKLARDSALLHRWPEFGSWLPPERSVQELLLAVGRRLPPDRQLSSEELASLLREQVAAATDRHFTPERRAVLARRMKDSALSVVARLGEHAGLQVSAVIHVIQGAGLITNPPSDVKFLTGYFDKALAILAGQQGGQLRIPIPHPAGASDSVVEEATEAGEMPAESPAAESPAAEAPNGESPAPEASPAVSEHP